MSQTQVSQYTLIQIVRDAIEPPNAGRWHEAVARCKAALAAHREAEKPAIKIGTLSRIVQGISRLLGTGTDLVSEAAYQILEKSPADIVCRELAAIVEELQATTD